MKNYRTIKEIVDQLNMSDYECIGGFLKNNIAFIRLCEIAKLDYQPKFQLNEKVVWKGDTYFIRGMRTVSSSHPNPEIEYDLSIEFNRTCTSNKTDHMSINEKELMTFDDYELIEVERAKKLLISKGIISA